MPKIMTHFYRLFSLMIALILTAGALTPVWAETFDQSPVEAKRQPSALPEGWQHGPFMEIFVRSWKDSNGDGIGDLKGLISKLDYLKDLGIKGIWLMPVTRSADGDHGYATTDFRAIEPAYGSLDDFDELIRQSHKRGIGVIMDYVVNHSAFEHPAFQAALTNPTSPYRDWYVWSQEAPKGWDIWGKNPWTTTNVGSYFATFGPHMPDFNLRNPQVVAFHQNNLRFWLNRGLDGFRLDAVPHLIENNARDWNDQPESRQLTHELVRLIKSYPGRYVVCEATAEPDAYANSQVCGGAFAFGLERHIAMAAKGDSQSIAEVASYFEQHSANLATFVSNHDSFAGQRLWDQVQGDEARYKLAAASYLLLPGTPFIYYGEEIGMAGAEGLREDPQIRGPLSWTRQHHTAGFTTGRPYRALSTNADTHHVQNQTRGLNSIWAFYRQLLALRNSRVSIARGSYEFAQTQGQVMSFQRRMGREHSLIVINYGQKASTVSIDGLTPDTPLRRLLSTAPLHRLASGQLSVPALSVQVFALEKQ